jgi:outer membrane protein assembly factor BamA
MEQRTSGQGILTFPLMYFATPSAFDPDALARDARRLEVWYAHHGWFDARFDGWRVVEVRRRRGVASAVVDAVGVVNPGPQSLVSQMRFDGLEGHGLQTVARTIERTSALQTGDPFDLELAWVTRDQAVERLQNNGRAYATVDMKVEARPEELAVDVQYDAKPGIASQFGEVSWDGLEAVPQKVVDRELPFSPGEAYESAALQEAQKNLFELGLFSLVTLAPDLSDPSRSRVPIRARVTESKFRTLRVGAGLQYDAIALSPRVSVSWRDQNLGKTLTRFELDGSFGYVFAVPSSTSAAAAGADLPDNANAIAGTPLFSAYARMNNPFLAGNVLEIAADAGVKSELQSIGLVLFRGEGDVGLVVHPNREIAFDVGFHAEQNRFTGPSVDVVEGFSRGVNDQSYGLFAADLGLTIDWRDDPLSPSRGTYSSLDIRQAFGSFQFTRVNGEWRGYLPLRVGRTGFPFVWANRLRGRLVQAWGDSEIPYVERAFMGGSTSLRGFRLNSVGPYKCKCTYDGDVVTRSYLANGGTFGLEAASELRYDWKHGITFSAFGEVGLLADGWDQVVPTAIRWGGGVGARYQSPVGPIRLDIGLRPSYPEDLNPTRTFGCDAADILPRAADLLRQSEAFRGEIVGGAKNNPPIAINVFLAIGEAI